MQRFESGYSLQDQLDAVSKLIDESPENHNALYAWYCRLIEFDSFQSRPATEIPAIRHL